MDIDRFQTTEVEIRAKTHSNEFIIGFIGRLAPEKNVGLFILTANYLIKTQIKRNFQNFQKNEKNEKKIRFHVIGDGPMKTHMLQLCVMFDIVEYFEFKGIISNDIYDMLYMLF